MVDRWTNPTTASLRGEDSRPLQQTFSSLSSYLEKLDNAITAAAASGVSSLSAGTGISLSGGSGAITVSNAGVTSLAGTANQVTVSAGTGAITISLPNAVTFNRSSATAWNAGSCINLQIDGTTYSTIGVNGNYRIQLSGGLDVYGSLTLNSNSTGYYQASTGTWSGNPANGVGKLEYHSNRWYLGSGPDSAEIVRIRRGGNDEVTISNDGQIYAYGYRGNENVGGTGEASWHPAGIYSNGNNWLYGPLYLNGNNINSCGTIYTSNWFRSQGGSGWYNESYGGGIWMNDSTWIRTYGSKNFYCDAEIRVNGVLSSNSGRSRGSYGALSIGSNGYTNGWDGIEFASPQTFMIQGDYNSGVYRNNNTWNWLFQYSSLLVGSDERYKRDIQPLNAGLDFIELLNPISYLKLTEAPDDDPEATEPSYYYGFSAQNVRAALDAIGESRDVQIHNIGGPNMDWVACTEDAVYDRQFIGITEFIAPLVQAVKELSSRVKQLEQGVAL